MNDHSAVNVEPLSDEDIEVLAEFFTLLIEMEQDLKKKGISIEDI